MTGSCPLADRPARTKRAGEVVVDPGGGRVIGVGEFDTGGQGCRDNVTTSAEVAARAVMSALDEGLGYPLPAQTMLAQRRGPGARPLQPPATGPALVSQRGGSMPGLNM